MASVHRPRAQTLTGVETKATFRLRGNTGLTAAEVTHRLGLQPTTAHEAGDPLGLRSAHTHPSSLWMLSSSPGIEPGTELADHLHRLLAILEPVSRQLWELVSEGYEANWYCWIASHATEHAAELDRPTMQRLLALPGDLAAGVLPSVMPSWWRFSVSILAGQVVALSACAPVSQ